MVAFINERRNRYLTSACSTLHHFTSGQVVTPDVSKQLLAYSESGLQEYMSFRNARFVTKEMKLSDTIKRKNLPSFRAKGKAASLEGSSLQTKKATSKKLGKMQKEIDMARSRGIATSELLKHDLVEESPLFHGDDMTKPQKHIMIQELEKQLEKDDYAFDKQSNTPTVVIVDFMSVVRKVPFAKCSTFKEALAFVWHLVTTAVSAGRVDIVYDSYLEGSIKESERRHRSPVDAVEVVNMKLSSPIPVELERFWASAKNKENMQLMSRVMFASKAAGAPFTLVLSGYVTDSDGAADCVAIENGVLSVRPELHSSIEEADCRLIPHVHNAVQCQSKRVLILSNDTDVVLYTLAYHDIYEQQGIEELWIQFGTGDKTRHIPVHTLAKRLGANKLRMILKAHILTGSDVTFKVGTKAAALKAQPERYLQDFGENTFVTDLVQAEKYLVNVVQAKSTCATFDELRYNIYTSKNKTLTELPPTSSTIRGHLLRCHYFVRVCVTLLDLETSELSPLNFGWKQVNGMLLPEKNQTSIPEEYTLTCACKKGCTRGCSCKRNEEQCIEHCKCQNCSNK